MVKDGNDACVLKRTLPGIPKLYDCKFIRLCFHARNIYYWNYIIYWSLLDKLYIVYRNYSQSKFANCFKQWKCPQIPRHNNTRCLILDVAPVEAFTLYTFVSLCKSMAFISRIYRLFMRQSRDAKLLRVRRIRAHTWHISDVRPGGICILHTTNTAVDKIMTKVILELRAL